MIWVIDGGALGRLEDIPSFGWGYRSKGFVSGELRTNPGLLSTTYHDKFVDVRVLEVTESGLRAGYLVPAQSGDEEVAQTTIHPKYGGKGVISLAVRDWQPYRLPFQPFGFSTPEGVEVATRLHGDNRWVGCCGALIGATGQHQYGGIPMEIHSVDLGEARPVFRTAGPRWTAKSTGVIDMEALRQRLLLALGENVRKEASDQLEGREVFEALHYYSRSNASKWGLFVALERYSHDKWPGALMVALNAHDGSGRYLAEELREVLENPPVKA